MRHTGQLLCYLILYIRIPILEQGARRGIISFLVKIDGPFRKLYDLKLFLHNNKLY